MSGKLYVVATPIGNLADISQRAIDTLKQVDLIAAEDTRHVQMLLHHYGISKPVWSCHQHNEQQMAQTLAEKILSGENIALVSDAGTPLLSDPGLPVVQLMRQQGIDVSPIPGPCALIAALSAAGLPTSRFSFEGFLPRTQSARINFFQHKLSDASTWVFYESNHRILDCLSDMAQVFPSDHPLALARELTKLHETIAYGSLAQVLARVQQDEHMRKGELVVVVGGMPQAGEEQELSAEDLRILGILMSECSVKTAAALAAEITGRRKKSLYQAALALQSDA
jgi:16S rRNA (cytidine1402-2'-O)-methyltransferase